MVNAWLRSRQRSPVYRGAAHRIAGCFAERPEGVFWSDWNRREAGTAEIEVIAISSHDIYTAAEVGTLTRDQVIALVAEAKRDTAEAVLVPDTAMHSLAWADELEAAAGMPVLTANQVTIFEGLRLGGRVPPLAGLGTLFTSLASAVQ